MQNLLGFYDASAWEASLHLIQNITISSVFMFFGCIALFILVRIYDKLETRIDFIDEIKKGNVACSVFIGSIILAIGIIIAHVVS